MRTSAVVTMVLSLMAGATVALSAMLYGAGKFEWNGFYPWVIGPYFVLVAVFGLSPGQTHARALAGCVAAVMVLLASCWFYIGMWFQRSSTTPLIFIFAPIYLFVGGMMIWGVAWYLLARARRTP